MFLVDCGGSSVSMTALLVEKLWLAKYLNVVQQGTTMDKIITSQLKGYCLENDRKLGSNIGGKRHLISQIHIYTAQSVKNALSSTLMYSTILKQREA